MNHKPTPHPTVSLMRSLWQIVLALFVLLGLVALSQMASAAWWVVPIVLVFALGVFVLLRNRRKA